MVKKSRENVNNKTKSKKFEIKQFKEKWLLIMNNFKKIIQIISTLNT
jgi:hypothetical protein